MLKFRFLCILTALVLMALPAASQDIDVTGDWELTMETPRGEMTADVTFVQEGEKLTVTMTGRGGREHTGEGTITGNSITWTITRSTPRGEFTVTYTGTVEVDSMSGEAAMGDMGTREWTAKKKES